VQLVKVSSGHHIWSETYDRTLEDVFATQDEIARSVVKELRTTLLGREADADLTGQVQAEVAKAAKGRGVDPEAHRLYLLARHLINRWTRENVADGIKYLKEALEMDPEFALAWAELGATYAREAGRGWVPASVGYARAREAVERATALEPDLVEGHTVMGWIQMTYDWDWQGADASYKQALALAPGNAKVLGLAGVMAGILGRHEEADALYRQVLERDPLSVSGYNNLGQELNVGGHFAEAEQAYRKALELAPQSAGTRASLALTLLAQGRGKEALAEAAREPVKWYSLWALATVHHAAGQGAASDAALRELTETCAEENAFQVAEVHGFRGDANAAFEWLERAYVQRDSGLAEAKANPYLRSLHGDPRWDAFMKKMGFEG
ncbi:MAG: tetratricopeptide repeat protein, partial [Candidatus Eiseniibacteriota bacterium]